MEHKYKGWSILGIKHGFVACRNSDDHVAPFTYRTFKAAKASIDDGEADKTPKQILGEQYLSEVKEGLTTKEQLMKWSHTDDSAHWALLKLKEF